MATSFDIKVPKKIAAGELPVMRMKVLVDLDSEATVGSKVKFSITDPEPSTKASPDLNTDSTPPAVLTFTLAGRPGPFAIQITSPSSTCGPPGDPCRKRYVLQFDLNADYDVNNLCQNSMTSDETWTIAVSGGGHSINDVCVMSYDRKTAGQCSAAVPMRPVKAPEAIAAVVGAPASQLGCVESRPGLDAILVLDRSGSMGGAAKQGQPMPTRMDELHGALVSLVNVWDGLRASEGTATPTDRIGVTLFDDQVSWWPALAISGLNDYTVAGGPTGPIVVQRNTILPGNFTSIGKGLVQADMTLNLNDLARRRVILLMSDGLQNTDPMVAVLNNQVVTHLQNSPNITSPLPNQSKYQIYAVTVGTSAIVNAQINQDIAKATGGFYINSEDDAALMSPFFLELLQNFVRFNTWQTNRLIHEELTRAVPVYTTTFPMSTTTQHVSVALRCPEEDVMLRLSVTPAGETTPTQASTSEGVVVLNFDVPSSPAYDYLRDWKLVVEKSEIIIGISRGADEVGFLAIPFDLAVIGDDTALEAKMSVVAQDYVPGDQIRFETRVTEFDKPVLGLGSQPGDEMVVQIVKPGQGVGDLLSTSSASSMQPFPSDHSTTVEAKLYNQLQQHPESLNRVSGGKITLTDSGDGVYRGAYTVEKPGHYNFVFGLQGKTKETGRFSFQQLSTTYVKAKPDATATTIQTSTQTVRGGNQLIINMTPKTKLGDRLGPGWPNYFWFSTPGRPPFKAKDNLDGSYTATLLYNILPPSVTLHFLDVSIVIGDAVTPDKLPVPLDDTNVLVPFVNPLPFPWNLPLPLLILVLFLLGVIIGFIFGLLV